MNGSPLLVIAGPTGAGKSRLGLEVARRLGGEIVSADAFAVYRGMDIGTAKPGEGDRASVPHHLIDIVEPGERISAGDWAQMAERVIAAIRARGATPVVVGGSHFYLRALLLGLFPAPSDTEVRDRLRTEWAARPDALFERLETVDPDAAARIGPRDGQRIVRALEVWESSGEPISAHWRRHDDSPRHEAVIVAPERDRADLYARIDQRVDTMFAVGLAEEVRGLLESGVEASCHALKAIGYREAVAHLCGELALSDAVEHTKRATRNLAKRQLTWLRHLKEGELRWVPAAEAGGADDVIRLWSTHSRKGER